MPGMTTSGCSLYWSWSTSQDTEGSVPFWMSDANSLTLTTLAHLLAVLRIELTASNIDHVSLNRPSKFVP